MKYVVKILVKLLVTFIVFTPVFVQASNVNPFDLFENHGSVMLLIDTKSGDIVGANKAAVHFYGYPREKLLSMNINAINTLSPSEISDEMAAAQNQKRHYFIFTHRLADGTFKNVEVYSYPYMMNNKETLFSIIHNITPRIQAENTLRQRNLWIQTILLTGSLIVLIFSAVLIRALNKIKSVHKALEEKNVQAQNLFSNMQEGFALHEIICNERGEPIDYRFLDTNKAFEAMTSLKSEAIKDKTVLEVLPETEDYWIEKYGQVALSGQPLHFENYSKEMGKYFSVNVFSPEKGKFATLISDITTQVLSKEAIAREKNILERILEDTLAGYWDWNLVDHTEYLSPGFKKMLGYEDDELPNSPETWQRLIYAEDLPGTLECFKQHVDSLGKIPFYNEVRYRHKDGSTVWVICAGHVLEWDDENKPLRMVGCHIDITESKKLEQSLDEERERFKMTMLSMGDGVISVDINGRIKIMNAVAEKLTGWTGADACGKPFEEVFNIISEQTRLRCDSPIQRVFDTGQIVAMDNHTLLMTRDGREIPVEDSAAPIKDKEGNIKGAVLVFRDFTEKKEKLEQIKYLSFHDQLTGLYNRRFFEEELKRLDTSSNWPLTLVMLDVNGLKLINDAFGHVMGDRILQRAANLMRTVCRTGDIIARIGGDEFVILLPRTSSKEAACILEQIIEVLPEEQDESVHLSISYGWATKETSDVMFSDIFKAAEDHMYRQKLSESRSMRYKTIDSIIKTLYEKTLLEKQHAEHVSQLCRSLALAMKLDSDDVRELETAGLVHDIGKIAIDLSILDKPSKLSDEERSEIQRHPEIGYQIVRAINEFTRLAEYILAHHERWDGAGYPRGLKGEEIPVGARIMAIADAYDAMTSERPYRKALSKEAAMEELKKNAGTQFDPDMIYVFDKVIFKDGRDNKWELEPKN
ncbi:PAS domain S-box protein [Cellulosilyticum sp. I15G10I2]|uniref:PAS domain S-box protein n=1 Tax=Cellulosilyticum sp. I15G10I2 TaxID=1892843 RepID=UPI00085BAEC3|nr:PAS domain S-box protein [Cellulosilyticum sp. I15G10I2]